MIKRWPCSIIDNISGVRVSIVSLVMMIGFSDLLIALDNAIVVAEFLETSPIKIEESASATNWSRIVDLANEPDSVLGRKETFGTGGSLFLSESGKRMLRVFMAEFVEKNSAF